MSAILRLAFGPKTSLSSAAGVPRPVCPLVPPGLFPRRRCPAEKSPQRRSLSKHAGRRYGNGRGGASGRTKRSSAKPQPRDVGRDRPGEAVRVGTEAAAGACCGVELWLADLTHHLWLNLI
ncbi:hypothetical protein ANANG_G00316510 [Anguilla anguilla]|uniref:Uncharacterized protein n=1 Tax=Anguilla anguilla TaxID=7936 RepID=A0A9D3RJH6_ANGAN|nr:hypothetical protein ANANG_G00316510 [Anguilla anguilla]